MSTRADIRGLLETHGLHLKRALGQSFLVDDRALSSIAEAAVRGGERTVVEIGTGLATLTRQLTSRAERVVTLERDAKLIPVLRDLLAPYPNLTLVEGDALEVDYAELARRPDQALPPDGAPPADGAPERPAVCGNIPYSITTPILLTLLGQRASIGTVTLMMQKEVAERLVAEPDTREYGSLTVLFRLHADITTLFDVPAGCFLPAPKVCSTVLQLRFLDAPRVDADPPHLERVVRAAFSQRRKTLRNSLSTAFPRTEVEAAGSTASIALERRAETLSLEEFARLAAALPRATST